MSTFWTNAINFPNLTAKAVPVAADLIPIADSADTFKPKQITLASLITATGVLFNNFVVDFGSSPTYDGYFTITDAGVSSSSNIIITQSGVAASGQDADENELINFHLTVTPGTGNFSVYLQAEDGYVAGKYTFYYAY
jgi:hypothetical protein